MQRLAPGIPESAPAGGMASGQFTQQDPIGIAGGLNLYGYANGDPINFSDPFGLCAEASGDTIRVEVDVRCPDGSEEKQIVEAVQATPEQLAAVSGAVSNLAGGGGAVTPESVAKAYQPVLEAGNVFVYPATTSDGGLVTTGGQTQSWPRWMFWTTPRVAFNARLVGSPNHPLFYQAVGHEGAHLVSRALGLGLSETDVRRILWGAR